MKTPYCITCPACLSDQIDIAKDRDYTDYTCQDCKHEWTDEHAAEDAEDTESE